MSRLRKLPSPALIVALLALFVALGGTGYAVSKIPRNSVGNKQLKKNAVSASKIRKNAITAEKIKNGSVSASKLTGRVGDATKLDGKDSTDFVPASKLQTFNVGMNRGDGTKLVYSYGPFSFSGRCENDGGGNIRATLEASTSAGGSAFESDLFVDPDWNPNESRVVQTLTAPPGGRTNISSNLKMFNTGANVYTYMADGEPIGLLVGYQGAECRFIGHLVFYG